ncbi:hypothetical protein SAMN04515617_10271 [Collimonas sp. OK242]|nr:hypothetical protein SAMN04515617_10271 [Collimonas sp. OK242]
MEILEHVFAVHWLILPILIWSLPVEMQAGLLILLPSWGIVRNPCISIWPGTI